LCRSTTRGDTAVACPGQRAATDPPPRTGAKKRATFASGSTSRSAGCDCAMTQHRSSANGPRPIIRLAPAPAGGPRRIIRLVPGLADGRAARRVLPPRPQQTFANNSRTVKPCPGLHDIRLPGSQPVQIAADPDILVVEDVARILRCTVDTARRIPRDQLRSIPGPGRRQLYLREDVLAYVRSRGRYSPNAELLLAGARAEVLGSSVDRVRERSQRRRTS
jgi:hypothetical protein